jgi:hypothetical protein
LVEQEMKKDELLNVFELSNTDGITSKPKGCRQVSGTAQKLGVATTKTLTVLTSALLVCLTLALQFSPLKVVAQEIITVVLYDVDRETTGEVQKWIEVLSKKTNQAKGKTGVNFSFEVVSVRPGSLDQQVLALLRPQNKPGCFLLVNGNMIKTAAEKGSPLVVLSDPKTFGNQPLKREHILLNLDAGRTTLITTSGFATTSDPYKFMSEKSAYQRQQAIIPWIPHLPLSNDEATDLANQATEDDNQNDNNSSQSWLDWLENKVLSATGIFINTVCNSFDEDDEFQDYFGQFIGWADNLE